MDFARPNLLVPLCSSLGSGLILLASIALAEVPAAGVTMGVTSANGGVSAQSTPRSSPLEEAWIGVLAVRDRTNVEFVSSGKKYEIVGAAEPELLREVGKEIRITGRLEGDATINVVKAEPLVVKR